MNRHDIYKNYFMGINLDKYGVNKSTAKRRGEETEHGIVYTEYVTNRGIHFYTCRADKIRLSEIFASNYSLAFNIPSIRNGHPVIGMSKFMEGIVVDADRGGMVNNTLVIDFTYSDLSSIIVMDSIFSDILSRFKSIDCRFPIVPYKDRVKPISAQQAFMNMNIIDIEQLMNSIDCSKLEYTQRMFYGTNITEFNFDWSPMNNLLCADDMFRRCEQLKVVRGNIPSDNVLILQRIFGECTNLERIEGTFKGVVIGDAVSMFRNCHKLIDAGFDSTTEFEYSKYGVYAPGIFEGCSSIGNKSIKYLFKMMNDSSDDYDFEIFPNHRGRLMFGMSNIKIKSSRVEHIFLGIRPQILDISGVEFLGHVPDSLARLVHYGDEHYETFDKSVLPGITIINDSVEFEELYSGVCSVVDLRGAGKIGVQSKINAVIAFSDVDSDDKYIIIADKGWALT